MRAINKMKARDERDGYAHKHTVAALQCSCIFHCQIETEVEGMLTTRLHCIYCRKKQSEGERERERDWGNWCFRVVILSVVPRILQQGPGSYIIPPLSHTHTHSYSLLWQNTLLLSNIVQHRAALPAFINRAMQAQRALDSAASRTAEALRELVGRLVVLASWEWLTFRCASENETNRNKHFLGGQIENIFKFFQKMKICNLLGIEMQVN